MEARLERYLPNGAVIRMPSFTHSFTHLLSKNRKEIVFSYDIYGFAINRIYKQLYNMYISVFRWGSRSSRNYFSNVRTKAVASDSRKKLCAMPSIAASFVAAKRSFSRRFACFRRHKFWFLRKIISIDPGHPGDAFYGGYVPFERSPEATISRHRSVSCDRVNINKPKLRNFDRPLGLPGHLQ